MLCWNEVKTRIVLTKEVFIEPLTNPFATAKNVILWTAQQWSKKATGKVLYLECDNVQNVNLDTKERGWKKDRSFQNVDLEKNFGSELKR